MGFSATLSKIDKICFLPYVAAMAYPKQKPAKVSKSAGISLPVDLKDACSKRAADLDTSLSAVARGLFRQWLNETSDSLEASSQAKLAKAKSSVKKRR